MGFSALCFSPHCHSDHERFSILKIQLILKEMLFNENVHGTTHNRLQKLTIERLMVIGAKTTMTRKRQITDLRPPLGITRQGLDGWFLKSLIIKSFVT